MQHANLSQVARAAEIVDEFAKDEPLAPLGSRSPRTEMALRELANLQAQVVRLAAVIEANDCNDAGNSGAVQPCSDASIRGILQSRLERGSCFPADLFSDPAWDMLLDLYAAELAQVRVSVTSLCIASNAPTSTALRWISALEREKLIERRPDPLDGRRFFLSLTNDAVERFERYFGVLRNRSVI
jgi:DNA-binding MarR family transcriptional regulator